MSIKSKQKIANSLVELLEENNFNSISISAICEKSGLVRKTFYNNYTSKEEVLSFICTNILTESIQKSISLHNPTAKNLAYTFFNIGKENKEFLSLLRQHNKFHIFSKVLNNLIPEINHISITRRLYDMQESEKQLIYNFYTAGVLKMLESSLDNGLIDSPDRLSELFAFIIKED